MKHSVASANRIESVDFLKGISIVGVLILHSNFASRFDLLTLQIQGGLAVAFDWAVLGFFFASGLTFGLERSVGDIAKKGLVLLGAYLFYHVAYAVVISLLVSCGIANPGESTQFGRLLQFWNSTAFQLYFLPVLAFFMVSIALIRKFIGEYWKWFACCVIIVTAIYYGSDRYPDSSNGPAMSKWALYAASFVFGILFKGGIGDGKQIGIPVILALAFLAITGGKGWGMVVPLMIVGSFEFTKPRKYHMMVRALGASSGSIYLWHTPVLLPALTIIFFKVGVYPLVSLVVSITLALLIPIWMRFLLVDWAEVRFGWKCPRWITL
jgi:hypothetical protein